MTSSPPDVRLALQSEHIQRQLALVATKHLPPERLCRLVLSACNRTPALLRCTQQSVLQAALTCSQYGIEPDGRHAHLIPYGDQCQLIIDYKGLIVLARRNGITGIVPDIICANDEFIYYRDEAGTHFKHGPKFGDRGGIIGAYSTARINGEFDVEVMSCEEIEAVRRRSRAGESGPWKTDWPEMAKKTVVRRHSKRWPLAAEIAEAFNSADEEDAPLAAKPIFSSQPALDSPPLPTNPVLPSPLPGEPVRRRPGRPAKAAQAPGCAPEPPAAPVEPPDPGAGLSSPAELAGAPAGGPQNELADFCSSQGVSFDLFAYAVAENGWLPDIENCPGFADLPTAFCVKMLGARVGLKRALAVAKELKPDGNAPAAA